MYSAYFCIFLAATVLGGPVGAYPRGNSYPSYEDSSFDRSSRENTEDTNSAENSLLHSEYEYMESESWESDYELDQQFLDSEGQYSPQYSSELFDYYDDDERSAESLQNENNSPSNYYDSDPETENQENGSNGSENGDESDSEEVSENIADIQNSTLKQTQDDWWQKSSNGSKPKILGRSFGKKPSSLNASAPTMGNFEFDTQSYMDRMTKEMDEMMKSMGSSNTENLVTSDEDDFLQTTSSDSDNEKKTTDKEVGAAPVDTNKNEKIDSGNNQTKAIKQEASDLKDFDSEGDDNDEDEDDYHKMPEGYEKMHNDMEKIMKSVGEGKNLTISTLAMGEDDAFNFAFDGDEDDDLGLVKEKEMGSMQEELDKMKKEMDSMMNMF